MVKSSSFKLIWDGEALDQLKGILEYLDEQSEQAPKIVKKAIFERLLAVQRNPLTSEVDKLKDPMNVDFRAFVVFSYRVTYQIENVKKEIRVLRVRHTSREPLGY
jgi:plasmid stabilization system protein ParE